MRRFLLKLLLLGLVVMACQMFLALFVFKGDVPEPVTAFREGVRAKARVWYFGDSTILFATTKDRDQRPLCEMVRDLPGGASAVTISRGGFQPAIYANFCEAMKRRGFTPAVVIVPINLRSFSAGWTKNPYYQFERESAFLRHDSLIFQTLFRPLAAFKALDLHSVSQAEYERTPVRDGARVVGTVLDFENPSFATPTEENLRKKLVFYYMAELTDEHPYLQALDRVIRTLDLKQTRLIVYISPIDHETVSKHLGETSRLRIAQNVATIQRFLAKRGVTVVDLSRTVGSDGFDWSVEGYPNEHMTELGRAVVIEKLALEMGKESGKS